jgi:hypothetical protein
LKCSRKRRRLYRDRTGYSIVAQAGTKEELPEMVLDAVRCHFDDVALMSKIIRLHLVHDEVPAA